MHNNVELKTSEGNTDLKYKISSSNSLLLLHTVKQDHGKYQCMVTNEAGQDVIDLHLDIYGKHHSVCCLPIFLNVLFLFYCFFSTWQIITLFSLPTFFLIFFYCIALSFCLTFFLFFMLVPPIVTVESNEIIGTINKPITLSCQADGHPLPLIYWTKADRSIDTQPGK